MKVAQRIIAILLIFIIWIAVFLFTYFLKREGTYTSIAYPKNTIGIVEINARRIFSNLLFDYGFRNKDAKMMKIVSEYYQNWAQDKSKKTTPIDFSENFCLIKIKVEKTVFWMLAGKPYQNNKNSDGFIHKGTYYEILNATKNTQKSLNTQLIKQIWYNTVLNDKQAISYKLINQGKEINTYDFSLNKESLQICFNPTGSITCLVPDTSRGFFHLSTRLNSGSFLPGKYQELRTLTDKLKGFSLNYYGAKYIDDINKGTYIDPQFDLLFNFSQPTKTSELTLLLRKLAKEDVRIESGWIYLNRAKYRLKSINDTSVFIGKNPAKLTNKSSSFAMQGKPQVLTKIDDLGWTGGLLELIPEYRALKDFSESVASIRTETCHDHSKSHIKKSHQCVNIKFKQNCNARLETLRVLLTVANAYQFEQD